jgi:hypothetical protein
MMHDESELPIFTHAGRIPPVSGAQMAEAIRQSLANLPYTVTFGEADALVATIPLTSGRSIYFRPNIMITGEAVMVKVDIDGLDEDDVPEVMAIHEQVIDSALFIARVVYVRTRVAA